LTRATLMRERMSKHASRLQLVRISWGKIERISAITGRWRFDSKLGARQLTTFPGDSDPKKREACRHGRAKLPGEDQLESLTTRRSDLRGSGRQSD